MSDPRVDAAYSARGTVTESEFDAVMRRYRDESDRAVAELAGHPCLRYDTRSDVELDIWGVAPGERRPAVIAVHGGYWRMLSRHDTAFMARVLADQQIATVPLDYDLAPAATLEEIVRQVRTAVAWLHRFGADHGVDPERLYVTGSSAGGHLAAMTVVGGWQHEFDLPAEAVKGALAISGLFDIRPLVDSFANEWLGLDAKRAADLSPCLAPAGTVPLVVADAEHEASGFHQQADLFDARWRSHARSTRITVPDRHHFDVFLDLADPRSILTRALVGLVR